MESDFVPVPKMRWIFAAWAAVGAFTIGFAALQRSLNGLPLKPLSIGIWVLSLFLWALITPLMWRISNHVRLEAGIARFVLVHALAVLCFTMAESALDVLLLLRLFEQPMRSYARMNLDMLVVNTFSYAAVVAIEHIRRYQLRLAAEAARAAQLASDLQRARLQALEGQLRPHFLFNALNTIASLVRANEQTAAVSAVAALGDVLRGALKQTAPEVALSEELGLASRYLDLERARFGDALSFSVEADPGTARAQVPSLLLQPLVENALKHGRGLDGRAKVRIRALCAGSDLRIEVSDGGSGPALGARDGIGLSNTRARLRHLYGDRARLQLLPAAGGGAVAVVELPLREAPRG